MSSTAAWLSLQGRASIDRLECSAVHRDWAKASSLLGQGKCRRLACKGVSTFAQLKRLTGKQQLRQPVEEKLLMQNLQRL